MRFFKLADKPKGNNLFWYNLPNADPKLTQKEMAVLDQFRRQESHPAAKMLNLPVEVQDLLIENSKSVYRIKRSLAISIFMFKAITCSMLLFYLVESRVIELGVALYLGVFLLALDSLIFAMTMYAISGSGAENADISDAIAERWEKNYIREVRSEVPVY